MLNRLDRKISGEAEAKAAFLSREFEALYDFMRNLGDSLAENLEIENVLNYIIKSAVAITNSDAGAILLKDDRDQLLRVKAVFGVFPPPYEVSYAAKVQLSALTEFFKSTPIKIGETVLGEAGRTGRPVFIPNSFTDDRLRHNTGNDACFIGSLIAVPLKNRDRIIGVISIVRKERTNSFSESDYGHVCTFADYASISLNNLFVYLELLEKKDMERDLGIAAGIQARLLPQRMPYFKNISVSAFSAAAKGVNGDYYDVFRLNNGNLAVIVCDVAGKGVPASLVMIMIRTILHLIVGTARNAARIVSWINKGLINQIEHYATLSILIYDPATNTVEYSNAGHHPLLLYRKRLNKFLKIDTSGIPVGIDNSCEYRQKRFKPEKDDILLLYTDGIIEARNERKQEYGVESLLKIVQKKARLHPAELSDHIMYDIKAFTGRAPQHDDQTLLILKVT